MNKTVSFLKYPHLEKLGHREVEGLLAGTCYVFPKLDGTNGSLWFSKDEKRIKGASRRRVLDLEQGKDNQGFLKTMLKDQRIENFFRKYPSLRLFGEWLVPHSLKTYRKDAWRKFYIFDVHDGNTFLHYEKYKPLLEEFSLEYIPPLFKIDSPSYDFLIDKKTLAKNRFLLQEGEGLIGEGLVIKNYDFLNVFGRVTWGKVISEEFKDTHLTLQTNTLKEKKSVEKRIVEKFVTQHLVEKEYHKILNNIDETEFPKKDIPRLLGTVFYCLITEEMWSILKEFKNPCIDFRKLVNETTLQVRQIKKDLFKK